MVAAAVIRHAAPSQWVMWRTTSALVITPAALPSFAHTTTRSTDTPESALAASMSSASSPTVVSRFRASPRRCLTYMLMISPKNAFRPFRLASRSMAEDDAQVRENAHGKQSETRKAHKDQRG